MKDKFSDKFREYIKEINKPVISLNTFKDKSEFLFYNHILEKSYFDINNSDVEFLLEYCGTGILGITDFLYFFPAILKKFPPHHGMVEEYLIQCLIHYRNETKFLHEFWADEIKETFVDILERRNLCYETESIELSLEGVEIKEIDPEGWKFFRGGAYYPKFLLYLFETYPLEAASLYQKIRNSNNPSLTRSLLELYFYHLYEEWVPNSKFIRKVLRSRKDARHVALKMITSELFDIAFCSFLILQAIDADEVVKFRAGMQKRFEKYRNRTSDEGVPIFYVENEVKRIFLKQISPQEFKNNIRQKHKQGSSN